MQITLQQLNESYPALVKLAQTEFPKERHKLAYKLSRILKSAKNELEAATESVNDLKAKCEGESDFQAQFKTFMTSTSCDLWGDPITLEEIAGVVAISPFDLALLDWLIVEETPVASEQAQSAAA